MEGFIEIPRIRKSRQILCKRRYWMRDGGNERERGNDYTSTNEKGNMRGFQHKKKDN